MKHSNMYPYSVFLLLALKGDIPIKILLLSFDAALLFVGGLI